MEPACINHTESTTAMKPRHTYAERICGEERDIIQRSMSLVMCACITRVLQLHLPTSQFSYATLCHSSKSRTFSVTLRQCRHKKHSFTSFRPNHWPETPEEGGLLHNDVNRWDDRAVGPYLWCGGGSDVGKGRWGAYRCGWSARKSRASAFLPAAQGRGGGAGEEGGKRGEKRRWKGVEDRGRSHGLRDTECKERRGEVGWHV